MTQLEMELTIGQLAALQKFIAGSSYQYKISPAMLTGMNSCHENLYKITIESTEEGILALHKPAPDPEEVSSEAATEEVNVKKAALNAALAAGKLTLNVGGAIVGTASEAAVRGGLAGINTVCRVVEDTYTGVKTNPELAEFKVHRDKAKKGLKSLFGSVLNEIVKASK